MRKQRPNWEKLCSSFKEKTTREKAEVFHAFIQAANHKRGITWHELVQKVSFHGYGDLLTVEECLQKRIDEEIDTPHHCYHEINREDFKPVRNFANRHPEDFPWVAMHEVDGEDFGERYFLVDNPYRLHAKWKRYLFLIRGSLRNFIRMAQYFESKFPPGKMKEIAMRVRVHAQVLLSDVEMASSEVDKLMKQEDADKE